MRKLKLMTDYRCFPLWENTNDIFDNVNPDKLPISQELKQDLKNWAAKYDDTLNLDDPMNSGFKSEEEEKQFEQEGKNLQKRLQKELGEIFTIDLFQND